jgi:hypothetical protein
MKVLTEAYNTDATSVTRIKEMIGVKESEKSKEGSGNVDNVCKKFLLDCHTDSYTFIQDRAKVLLGERLGISGTSRT